jgi:hypothetical protein
MYIGEPNIVCAILTYNILQNPKSPKFDDTIDKNILSGFKSLCMILFLLSSLNAYNNCLKYIKAYDYLKNFRFFNRFSSVP